MSHDAYLYGRMMAYMDDAEANLRNVSSFLSRIGPGINLNDAINRLGELDDALGTIRRELATKKVE